MSYLHFYIDKISTADLHSMPPPTDNSQFRISSDTMDTISAALQPHSVAIANGTIYADILQSLSGLCPIVDIVRRGHIRPDTDTIAPFLYGFAIAYIKLVIVTNVYDDDRMIVHLSGNYLNAGYMVIYIWYMPRHQMNTLLAHLGTCALVVTAVSVYLIIEQVRSDFALVQRLSWWMFLLNLLLSMYPFSDLVSATASGKPSCLVMSARFRPSHPSAGDGGAPSAGRVLLAAHGRGRVTGQRCVAAARSVPERRLDGGAESGVAALEQRSIASNLVCAADAAAASKCV